MVRQHNNIFYYQKMSSRRHVLYLLWRMSFIVSVSAFLFVRLRSYVLALLRRYLIAASFCSCGWQESLGMITSVVVGFLYRVSHELRSLLRESVPYVKIYQCNPKHLCPKLNGFGGNDQRKVWSSSRFHVLYLFSWLTRDHNLHVLESGKQTRSRRCERIIGVSAYATQSLLMRAENW